MLPREQSEQNAVSWLLWVPGAQEAASVQPSGPTAMARAQPWGLCRRQLIRTCLECGAGVCTWMLEAAASQEDWAVSGPAAL